MAMEEDIKRIISYKGGMPLIKNNLKSFLIHVTISIISVFVFIIFNSSQAKWAYEEAANKHHNNMIFAAITMMAVAAVTYYLLRRKHLISQGNLYKNLFSVSLTAILGTSLWVVAFSIDRIGPSNSLLNSQLWQFYSAYNGYSLFFLNESGNNNPYVFLAFSFMPTIAMWTGMLRKRS